MGMIEEKKRAAESHSEQIHPLTSVMVFLCCPRLLMQNNPVTTDEVLEKGNIRESGEDAQNFPGRLAEGYTHTVCFSGGPESGDRKHVLVYREESAITKMHWLKLDPYRYQTESWSRHADATRQCECNTRAHTHRNCALINARGRRKVITFVCISGSDYRSDSKVKSLGLRLHLPSLPTHTPQAASHPVCRSSWTGSNAHSGSATGTRIDQSFIHKNPSIINQCFFHKT